jgi:hypothetical protein
MHAVVQSVTEACVARRSRAGLRWFRLRCVCVFAFEFLENLVSG